MSWQHCHLQLYLYFSQSLKISSACQDRRSLKCDQMLEQRVAQLPKKQDSFYFKVPIFKLASKVTFGLLLCEVFVTKTL